MSSGHDPIVAPCRCGIASRLTNFFARSVRQAGPSIAAKLALQVAIRLGRHNRFLILFAEAKVAVKRSVAQHSFCYFRHDNDGKAASQIPTKLAFDGQTVQR